MAEAIARKDASDIIAPLSAGIAPLGFVVETTKQTLLLNGYSADGLNSKPIDDEMWDAANLVINMTGRSGEAVFRGFPDREKIEDWYVRDPYGAEVALYQKIFDELRGRVNSLARRLRELNAK